MLNPQNYSTPLEISPTAISISELRAAFPGKLIVPRDPEYEEARTVFFGGIDRRPAAVIRVAGVSDVSRVVSLARVPVRATAFAHRKSRIMVGILASYDRPDEMETHESWAADFAAALRQSDYGAYVNFLGEEGEARVRAAYPGSTWDRLRSIKTRYDSTNLFRLNQNIPPMHL